MSMCALRTLCEGRLDGWLDSSTVFEEEQRILPVRARHVARRLEQRARSFKAHNPHICLIAHLHLILLKLHDAQWTR